MVNVVCTLSRPAAAYQNLYAEFIHKLSGSSPPRESTGSTVEEVFDLMNSFEPSSSSPSSRAIKGVRNFRLTFGLAFLVLFLFIYRPLALDVRYSMDLVTLMAQVQAGSEEPSYVLPARDQQSPFAASADNSYAAALTALSCFVTPYCYPRYRCRFGEPDKIRRPRQKWEEMAFCAEDLRHDAVEAATKTIMAPDTC